MLNSTEHELYSTHKYLDNGRIKWTFETQMIKLKPAFYHAYEY